MRSKSTTTLGKRKTKSLPKRIFVLHRGWVVIGRVAKTTSTEILITDASVIRRWGTTRGLGEIAATGPTSQTILDPCPPIRVHPSLGVIMSIDCEV